METAAFAPFLTVVSILIVIPAQAGIQHGASLVSGF
jgi:hypothetical protein